MRVCVCLCVCVYCPVMPAMRCVPCAVRAFTVLDNKSSRIIRCVRLLLLETNKKLLRPTG